MGLQKILLQQHVGTLCQAVVNVGDKVKKGQIIVSIKQITDETIASQQEAIEKNLAYYVRWIGSSTHILSLRKFDSYFSHIETLKYINENYNINEYKDIIKGIEEYRIPITIMGIYSEFCKSKLFEKEINDFINNEEIIRYLKSFKINDFTISNLKYYLLSKGILYFPKVVKKYYKS